MLGNSAMSGWVSESLVGSSSVESDVGVNSVGSLLDSSVSLSGSSSFLDGSFVWHFLTFYIFL